MKIMVAYDGTLQSKEALKYGMDKVRAKGGEVIALHVFNSDIFVDYDATVDAQNLARRESARFVAEAKSLISENGKGIRVGLFTTEGDPETSIISFAKENAADVLLCPPKFKGIINKYRRTLAANELTAEAEKMNLAALSAKSM